MMENSVCGEERIVEQTSKSSDYNADYGLLYDDADEKEWPSYWLGPEQGKTAYFILDLGCLKNIVGVLLKNSHHATNKKR